MIERTFDYRRVKRLAPHWDIYITPLCYYLIVSEDNVDKGAFYFVPYKDGFLVHTQFALAHRGKKALRSYKDSIAWIADNTSCKVLYGTIPSDNMGARILTRSMGVDFDGVDSEGLRMYSLNIENAKTKQSEVA